MPARAWAAEMRLARLLQLRAQRRWLNMRIYRKAAELTQIRNRCNTIKPHDILLFATVKDEYIRLPYFLDYYRKIGIGHFLIVDNNSRDGGPEFLANQPDVSLWSTKNSYKSARFGIDWLHGLLNRYGNGHWCLTVDPDELLVYPHLNTRPLCALTAWLDQQGQRSFPALLLDLFPKGSVAKARYKLGQNPLQICRYFDAGNYQISRNNRDKNLWIQGGPRARHFFNDLPHKSPALNKIPLVKWRRGYAYTSSTHALLPSRLNAVYDQSGGQKISGVLLHVKFLSTLEEKLTDALSTSEHYQESAEYQRYTDQMANSPSLFIPDAGTFKTWTQLETLGVMSRGAWA